MKKFFTIFWIFLSLANRSWGQITVPDTSFRKCLIERYPSVVNPSGQLIESAANNLAGILSCPSRAIESLEGLQHFRNISEVNFKRNRITSIPNIATLKKLRRFDVSENSLEYLPDFSKIKSLREIYATRNNIGSLPDLSNNDSLVALYIHNNRLDSFPDLSRLKQLRIIQVAYNNLKYLPNIDKISSLQVIGAWKNRLVALPDLSSLKNLEHIDVGYNELTTMPRIGALNNLDTAYFNDNRISILSDFSQCPKLRNVRLYHNPLTFKELIKLTKTSNYLQVFKLNPQDSVFISPPKMLVEGENSFLTTNIDKGVDSMYYEWFKNDTLVQKSSIDALYINQLSDSGNYRCDIRNKLFPSHVIPTYRFRIAVAACLDPTKLTFSSTGITCLNSGTLTFNANAQPIASYELTSNSGKKIVSTNGLFNGLNESSYTLRISASTGCSKEYNKQLAIERIECDEVLISPNEDGNADSHFFEEIGKVTIYDKRGSIVKTLIIPGEWNGASEKGNIYSGFYVADINNGKKLLGITVLY